jgi:uncharacterized protein YbgA (DUF1722 family)/uncharacterized protein YbbK (DUF523 family)
VTIKEDFNISYQAVKPIVAISKCMEFDSCRYNGDMISNEFIAELKPYILFIPVCPEMEIGLGVPREPIRIVVSGGKRLLYQPATGKDVSGEMMVYVKSFLDSLDQIDGFILKSKSPSCGIRNVKIYAGIETQTPIKKGAGFLGGEVVSRFGYLAVEDERRLQDFRIRGHFLTKLFTLARFRKLRENPSMKDLIEFHSRNKLLFISYSQSKTKILGNITANYDQKKIREVIELYFRTMTELFQNPARRSSIINVLEHAFKGVSMELSSQEKLFFSKSVRDYREKKVPLSIPLNFLHSWALRFEAEYLLMQTFIEPYPSALMDIPDSGKGKDL